MYAPLTAAGTVVVDRVVASNYAIPANGLILPHYLMHAALLPVRTYHALGLPFAMAHLWGKGDDLPDSCSTGSRESDGCCDSDRLVSMNEFHPYIDFLYHRVQIH